MSDTSKATPRPRKWLCQGGGGHEDGEDGIRAMTLSGEALVEMLEAYREDLDYDRLCERDKLARELAEKIDAQWKLAEKKQDLKLAILAFDMRDKTRQLLKLYEEEKP